jgi:Xaa-Pro aminopeptidase
MKMHRRNFIKSGAVSVASFGLVNGILSGCSGDSESFKELQNMTAGVEPLDAKDFKSRQDKAVRLMEENKIDGLFIAGGANLKYFLDLAWWQSERLFGAIMNLKGDPVWVCPAFEVERAREVINYGTDIRIWEEDESPYDLVVGIMKDLHVKSGILGIDPNVRNFVVEGIRKSASGTRIQLTDGSFITESCRGIKSEKELIYMDLANRITKMAYSAAFKMLKEGMSPSELEGLISQAHSKMGVQGGGDPQFGISSSSPHGTNESYPLKNGDIVLVDGGCSVEGYRSDVTRTVVFGEPTDRQKKIFDIILKARQSAMDAVHPGATCESIDAAARKVIEDAGYGPDYKYFQHRLGHGIGLEGHEYPYLVRGNKLELKPGMTFSNEPGIYIYNEFGIRVEDCFVVTEAGGKYLGGMLSTAIDNPFS